MAKIIEVNISVVLHDEANNDQIREVIQSVLDGEPHSLIESTELVGFVTADELELNNQELLSIAKHYNKKLHRRTQVPQATESLLDAHFKIRTEAWSDCRQMQVQFDSIKWAEQASDKQLLELVECGFERDYAADNVALFMADHNSEAKKLFDFLKIVQKQPLSGDTNGFEVRVNSIDFIEWLNKNRPDIAKRIDEE